MNLKIVVTGALLVVIGGLILFFPNVLTPPTQVYDHTYLLRVAPGNYSSVQVTVEPQQTLLGTIASGPDTVDFFLMNHGNFTAWTTRGSPPSQVYPQSKFGILNYTFTVAGSGSSVDYVIVLSSRSSNGTTNALVNLVLDNGAGNLESLYAPLGFIIAGVAIAALGATRKGEPEPEPPKAEEKPTGLLGLLSGIGSTAPTPTCRYCGAEIQEGAAFCPSCHKSLG